MIHVFFSEAGAGIMKLHQESGKIDRNDEILTLAFMLDQGDIRLPYNSQYRLDLIYKMYTQNGQIHDPKQIKDSIYSYVENVDRLIAAAEKGEEICIYSENSPGDVSGFIFVCSLLDPYDIGLQYVELPQIVHNPDYTTLFPSLENILYEYFDYVLSLKVEVPYFDVNYYSTIWESLKNENSPLRAVVNGQIMSVSEDIYDFMILNRFEVSKYESRAIGEIIGIYQQKLSDYLLADRIQKLIEKDALTVLEDNELPYNRLLIKTN
ncbi:hypothetical protein C815_01246 [Firmicutes bacterium M10-2]|nr:hypothetical protein C815_01246 [Firmicutes bacterium M10-2]